MVNVAYALMTTSDPFQMKKLGKDIPTTPTWAKKKDQVLQEIMKEKFLQNDGLKDKLLATKGLNLYEATKDKRYGTGYTIKEKKEINSSSPGQNLTGKYLMAIRDNFLSNNNV